MTLLCAFIVAFFAFTWTVRLLNHVVFMINVPDAASHPGLGPRHVALPAGPGRDTSIPSASARSSQRCRSRSGCSVRSTSSSRRLGSSSSSTTSIAARASATSDRPLPHPRARTRVYDVQLPISSAARGLPHCSIGDHDGPRRTHDPGPDAATKRISLDEYWMPFTPNREFKADPQMVVRAEGMFYWNDRGDKIDRRVVGPLLRQCRPRPQGDRRGRRPAAGASSTSCRRSCAGIRSSSSSRRASPS